MIFFLFLFLLKISISVIKCLQNNIPRLIFRLNMRLCWLLKIKTKIPILMNLQTFINRFYSNFFFLLSSCRISNKYRVNNTNTCHMDLVVKKTHTPKKKKKNIQQSSQQKLGGEEKSSKSSI